MWNTGEYGRQSHVCVPRRFSRVQPFVTPWTVGRQAPLSVGFSRQEYWSGWLCLPPGDLPNPGIMPASLHLLPWQVDSLPLAAPGKPRQNHASPSMSMPSFSEPVNPLPYVVEITLQIEFTQGFWLGKLLLDYGVGFTRILRRGKLDGQRPRRRGDRGWGSGKAMWWWKLWDRDRGRDRMEDAGLKEGGQLLRSGKK